MRRALLYCCAAIDTRCKCIVVLVCHTALFVLAQQFCLSKCISQIASCIPKITHRDQSFAPERVLHLPILPHAIENQMRVLGPVRWCFRFIPTEYPRGAASFPQALRQPQGKNSSMEYALDAIWGQRLCLGSQPCVKLLCVPGLPFDLHLLFFGPLAIPTSGSRRCGFSDCTSIIINCVDVLGSRCRCRYH
jgi:hypothetical protein